MRILVTGLCLQGNKGGPAIALSLRNQIRKKFPDANFIFSVPSGNEFQYEKVCSKKYSIDVVENFRIKDFIPPFCFSSRIKRGLGWIKALHESDMLLEMSAISYVGPPVREQKNVFLGGRLHYFFMAMVFRKPFLAWTQSFGPFSTKLIRFFAKMDLKGQKIIFCRGQNAYDEVRKLLPDKHVELFPDVATTLGYNKDWANEYIETKWGEIDYSRLVTISPSSVLYKRSHKKEENNSHVIELSELCQVLIESDYTVLFVPHTFRPNHHRPEICDYAVAKIIYENLEETNKKLLLEDDLGAEELKSIISNAHVHVGARYHSIVAALSASVPCVSLSWHPKYKDIMSFYGLQDFVHVSTDGEANAGIYQFVEKIEKNYSDYKEKMIENQKQMILEVERNNNMFCQLIKEKLK